MKKQGISRRLGFESLEQRTLMAGNVTASVVDNVLVITGDDASNFIEIRQLPAAESMNPWPGARYEVINPYVPSGDSPTLINGQSSVIIEGVKNGFSVKMNGGNDQVTVFKPGAAGNIANAPGNIVDFDMGSGNDTLYLYITNHQQVNVELGKGADNTFVTGKVSTLNVVGDPAWQAGDPPGSDSIELDLTAAGPVSVDAKYGSNDIRAKLTTTTSRAAVSIVTGNGNDNVILRDLTLSAPLRIDAGDGRDSVTLSQTESTSNVTVNTGRGNDQFFFFNVSLQGTLSAWLGEGDDLLRNTGTNRAGKIVFRGWDGTDTLRLDGTDTFDNEDITGFETILELALLTRYGPMPNVRVLAEWREER